MDMDDKPENGNDFSIELGDIIQIISPTNPDLDSNAFYVMYVDSAKIKLINITTYVAVQLTIDDTGTITDESIREIHLLTRSLDPGFARQNGLLPKTWIDIHFGGEIPYIATGEITNLEEDMIEIKTVENDVFYIDFEYKGLPEDIPIDKIVVRDPPAAFAPSPETRVLSAVPPSESDATIEYTENGESIINIPEGTVPDAVIDDVLHEIYLDANQLYGEDLEEIFQRIEIPEEQKKYNIETQVNDFMDELLSTIPNSRRTAKVMGKIHNLVERFKELRNMYSLFDDTGNVVGKKIYGDSYKPLLDKMAHLDIRLRWLIPAVKQTKKLYRYSEEEELPDAVSYFDQEEIEREIILHNNYYKNVVIGNENKYDSFYKNLNASYQVPFLPPNSQEELLTFKQEVMQDIDAIVNNYSSTFHNSNLSRFQYMVQRYNLGTYRAGSTEMKNGVKVSVKTQITPADKMSVQSWFVMPRQIIKYSHVDLPGSNILVRSQLSQNQIDFFRIFNSKSNFAVKFVDDLNAEINYFVKDDITKLYNEVVKHAPTEKEYVIFKAVVNKYRSDFEKVVKNDFKNIDTKLWYDRWFKILGEQLGEEQSDDTFAQKITEYVLDDTLQNEEDKHRKMLEVIIPNTRAVIKLMQKYTMNKLSFVDMVAMLEPFMIYPDNLTYGQYNEIRYHIKQYILEYKKDVATRAKDFYLITSKSRDKDKINIIRTILINLIRRNDTNIRNPEEIFIEHYDYNYEIPYTPSETLTKVLQKDYGALYFNLLTYTLLNLITPSTLVNYYENEDTKEDVYVRKQCAVRYLAKKYTKLEDLQKDNNAPAYWDKEFDDTPYDTISQYNEEREKMLPEKFKTFLEENLVQKQNCTRDDCGELAARLISGKRKIKDGEYAVVEMEYTYNDYSKMDIDSVNNKYYHYYVRKDNHWVRDKEIEEDETFLDNPSIFCNASSECYFNTAKTVCEPTKDIKLRIKEKSYKNMIEEFGKKLSVTVEELKSDLEKNIFELSTMLMHKNVLSASLLYKENNVAYNIGKYAVKHDIIQSPYIFLRDMILAQNDFIKKQQDICKFVSMFCREPIVENGEEVYWKYCIETNIKLFPSSLYQLASTFVAGEDYVTKLEQLCNQIGKLSDDGDAIVDQYSGYVLRKIDFVNEETYDESGFKITTHGILEKDIGTIAQEALTKKKDIEKVFENETSQMVYNVFHSLCGNMGIDPTNHEAFVMRLSLELLNNTDIVLSQSIYEKRTQKLEKEKGKVSAPYEIYRNQILITSVAALTLVSIQSALEHVRPRKTFPGCVYSFGGYPLDGGIENVMGIKYVACVIGKTKSSIVPWNSLEKITDGILGKRIRDFLTEYVVNKNEIVDMFVRKREYLLLNPDDSMPEEHNVSKKWKHFLPPIMHVSVSSSLQGTSKEFDDETVKLMKEGNKMQQTHYNVYKSKIIQHTYGIVQLINDNVRSKDVLMKTMSKVPYLENACCNDADMRLNPIQYFVSEDKNIDLYIKRSAKSEVIADKMRTLARAPYLFNRENTRFVYPDINDNYYEKEQNIYEAIIYYCNLDTEIPIPEDLLGICREKPVGYDKRASLEEKIELLKKMGKKYTSGDLSELMRIVNARNIQSLVSVKKVAHVSMLLDFLENMEQKNSTVIEKPLREKLTQVLLEYNPNVMIHEKENEMTPFLNATSNLRKYLISANSKMHTSIMQYMDSYGNLSNLKYNKMEDYILNLFTWEIDDNTSSSLYHICGFFKNSIHNITKLYPEMLLENTNTHTFLSKYWGFSSLHMMDIQTEINKYRENVQNMKNNKLLNTLMIHVKSWASDLYTFSQLIPVQTPIVKNGELFYGLFHKSTLYMLYMYCWYSTIYEYIQLSNDPELARIDIIYSKNRRREKNLEYMEEDTITAVSITGDGGDDAEEYMTEIQDIEIGDQLELKESVCAFLVACIETQQSDKKLIDKKYENIARSIKRTKEMEKQEIIRFLEDTENNDPKIEKMLKKYKLERWNVGNQKSLYKYDKEAYDKESMMEFPANANASTFLENPEPQGYDIEDLDRMHQEDINNEYDAEGMDISGLDEEYYNGVYYPEDMEE